MHYGTVVPVIFKFILMKRMVPWVAHKEEII